MRCDELTCFKTREAGEGALEDDGRWKRGVELGERRGSMKTRSNESQGETRRGSVGCR